MVCSLAVTGNEGAYILLRALTSAERYLHVNYFAADANISILLCIIIPAIYHCIFTFVMVNEVTSHYH